MYLRTCYHGKTSFFRLLLQPWGSPWPTRWGQSWIAPMDGREPGKTPHVWCFTMVYSWFTNGLLMVYHLFPIFFPYFSCENGYGWLWGIPHILHSLDPMVLTQLTKLSAMSNLPRPQFSIVLSGDSSSASNSKILWAFSLGSHVQPKVFSLCLFSWGGDCTESSSCNAMSSISQHV